MRRALKRAGAGAAVAAGLVCAPPAAGDLVAVTGTFAGDAPTLLGCSSPATLCADGRFYGEQFSSSYEATYTAFEPDSGRPGTVRYTATVRLGSYGTIVTARETGTIDVRPGGPSPFTAVITLERGLGRLIVTGTRETRAGDPTRLGRAAGIYEGELEDGS